MGSRRFNRDQWISWFSEFEQSGLTVREFCRRKQISDNSFYSWRKKLEVQPPNHSAGSASPFVPVSVLDSNKVEIDLPCGATIRVDRHSLDEVLVCLIRLEAKS